MRWELEKELSDEDSLMIAGLCAGCHAKVIARNTRNEYLQDEPKFRIVGASEFKLVSSTCRCLCPLAAFSG